VFRVSLANADVIRQKKRIVRSMKRIMDELTRINVPTKAKSKRQFFVIPKSNLTPSEKVWELLIQPCENSYADSNGRRLRIQTYYRKYQ
jgi:hypothetical protein